MADERSGRPQASRSLSFEDVFDVITGSSNIPSLPRRSRSVRRDPLRTRLSEPRSSPSASLAPLFGGSMSMNGVSSSSLEAVDLRQLEYVSHVYENLICTICVATLVNPVQLPCEHIFCLECLGTHFQTIPGDIKTCPKCRRRVNMVADVARPPKILREMLDDLLVRCPNPGCGTEMHRYTVHDHVSRYCGYTYVKCPEDDCGKTIERRRVSEGCLHVYVECEDCQKLVWKCDIEEHEELCSKARIACTHCPDTVTRPRLQGHLENDCLAYEIPCPGKSLGCTFRNFRIQVEEHAKTCPMAVMAPHIEQQRSRQERRIMEQEDKIKRQAEQLAELSRIQTKLSMLQDGLEQMQKMLFNEDGTPRSQISSSQQPLPDTAITNDAELKEHLSRQDEINAVHFSRIEELDARMQMLFTNENIRWQQEMMALGSAVTAMRTQLNTLTNAYLRQPSGGSLGAAAVAASAAGGHAAEGSMRPQINRPRSPRRGSSSSPHREDPKL